MVRTGNEVNGEKKELGRNSKWRRGKKKKQSAKVGNEIQEQIVNEERTKKTKINRSTKRKRSEKKRGQW